jgi:phosphoserine aminotransferase
VADVDDRDCTCMVQLRTPAVGRLKSSIPSTAFGVVPEFKAANEVTLVESTFETPPVLTTAIFSKWILWYVK